MDRSALIIHLVARKIYGEDTRGNQQGGSLCAHSSAAQKYMVRTPEGTSKVDRSALIIHLAALSKFRCFRLELGCEQGSLSLWFVQGALLLLLLSLSVALSISLRPS